MDTFVGCSGFHYDHWKGNFYPDDLSTDEWLPYYADHFDTVEINNSFYSLPEDVEVEHWYEQTPGNFRFAMKGSRYVTHMKKLVDDKDTRDGVHTFYNSVEDLKEKLGPILWQLPGNQHRDDEKLETFCTMLSDDFTNVIEFRHTSWFDEEVMEILENYGIINCIVSAPDNIPVYQKITGDTAYVRFHGKTEWYNYHYSEEELNNWSHDIRNWDVSTAYIYFNNDAEANAIENAGELKEMLS